MYFILFYGAQYRLSATLRRNVLRQNVLRQIGCAKMVAPKRRRQTVTYRVYSCAPF